MVNATFAPFLYQGVNQDATVAFTIFAPDFILVFASHCSEQIWCKSVFFFHAARHVEDTVGIGNRNKTYNVDTIAPSPSDHLMVHVLYIAYMQFSAC